MPVAVEELVRWSSAVWQTGAALRDPFNYGTLARKYERLRERGCRARSYSDVREGPYGTSSVFYAILSAYAVLLSLFRWKEAPKVPGRCDLVCGTGTRNVVGLLSDWYLATLAGALSLFPVLIASIWTYRFPDSRRRGWTITLLASVAIFVYVNSLLASCLTPLRIE